MAKRTTKRRIGGKAIASGSDGCVFDKKFDASGNPIDTPDTVSKVFSSSKQNVAEQEFLLQTKIKSITGGVGIVVTNLNKINIVPEINDVISSDLLKFEGCRTINSDKKLKKSPYYVIEYPKILGDMSKLALPPQPLKFFENAKKALEKLNSVGILHLDIAARNVFVVKLSETSNEAAIGDFGSAVDMKDPLFKSKLASRLQDITDGHIGNVLGSDQITPFFGIIALLYLNKDDSTKLSTLKDEIADLLKEYPKKDGTKEYEFEGGWMDKKVTYNTTFLPLIVENLAQFMKQCLTISSSEYEPIFKYEAIMTDQAMLELLMSRKTNEKIDGHLWTNSTRQLTGRLKLVRLGGRRKTKRRSTTKAKY